MTTETQTITVTRSSKKERLTAIRELLTRGYVPFKTYEYNRGEANKSSMWYADSVAESKMQSTDRPTAYVAVLRRKTPCKS